MRLRLQSLIAVTFSFFSVLLLLFTAKGKICLGITYEKYDNVYSIGFARQRSGGHFFREDVGCYWSPLEEIMPPSSYYWKKKIRDAKNNGFLP